MEESWFCLARNKARLVWTRDLIGLNVWRADLDRNRLWFGLDGRELVWFVFRVLACIFIKLSTSNYCTHKIDKYLQHYPPSPPQGGDGFDHCIIYGLRLYF